MCVQSGGVGFVLGLEIGDRNLEKRGKKTPKIKKKREGIPGFWAAGKSLENKKDSEPIKSRLMVICLYH